MFCPKCGMQNPDGARFCAGCGSPLPAAGVPGANGQGGVAPQPGSQSAPTYQTPVTVPGHAAQPASHRQPQHPKPHRSKKPLVIGIAAAAVAVVAVVVVLVVLPAVNPKPFAGTLDLTENYGNNYSLLRLDFKGDSALVGSVDLLGFPDEGLRVISTERHGDVMVYNLDTSSSDYWKGTTSLQAFAPVGASAEKPYGKWGIVVYANGSDGRPRLRAVNLVLNEDGTGHFERAGVETKADKSEASSVDDLMWASPLSDDYDPAVLGEHGSGDTGELVNMMDFAWTGDSSHMTIHALNSTNPNSNAARFARENGFDLSITESK